MSGLPWQKADDHIRIAVRLTPNGGRDAVDGIEADANGDTRLKMRVSAVPEKGKANKAMIAALAKMLGVSKSSVELLSGDTARQKILRIDGDPEDIIQRLEALVQDRPA